MNIWGIDVGNAGGIAILNKNEMIVSPMPLVKLSKGHELDGRLIASLMKEHPPGLVVIEKVHSMPGQGVASMFSFGRGFGRLIGICEGVGVPYELVRPQAWKKHMGIAGDKSSAIQKAKQLFPDINLLPTPRCRKESDGMAEAALLAEYGKRALGGVGS